MSRATLGEQAFLDLLINAPAAQDRRRSLRQRIGEVASLRQIVNGRSLAAFHALLIDASDGGLGVRCVMNLARGGLYRVIVEDGAETIAVNVRVVSARRRRDGSYDIGTRHV